MAGNGKNSANVSRRDMLKAAGTGLVVTGLAGGCAASGAQNQGRSQCNPTSNDGQDPVIKRPTSRHNLEADVVVVGGGMAGVCAAIAAARNKVLVILVQDRPVLGGNASSEIRMHVCGADCSGGRSDTDSRETGIIEEIRLEDAAHNPQRSASLFDLLLYDKVRREPNITLLLNTHCCGITPAKNASQSNRRRIASVTASRHGTEDTFKIAGQHFIDCTGDGRLGAEAGADYRVGREGRDEFNESMAVPKADRKTLGSTLLFTTREYDHEVPFVAPAWARHYDRCEDLPHRSHRTWEYGYWWVEWGGEIDTIKDGEHIRDELLASALGVWDHIKNSGRHPESANWGLEWLGFLPGKRESRRFVGDHMLIQQELEQGMQFPDSVAYGGWSIDLHPPRGIDSSEPPCNQVRTPLYNIPLGSLYSRNVENLLFAGRNMSASHVAFGSTRVMATCAVMGQAAGTAAALCARHRCQPYQLRASGIQELQQQLLKDDAYIIGATNYDPADLARTASVRASSETADNAATNVINGIHRRVYQQNNCWASDPKQAGASWLELRFPKQQRISEIRLTFDTGLSRPLTLSHSDAFNRKMIRGPQPETVRDYDLQLIHGESKRTVAQVKNNYQRQIIHRFDPETVSGLRVHVNATNGNPSSRIFEVRTYA